MIHFIRSMQPVDIEFAVACTRAEGWSGQTHLVLEDFLAYDPQGCFVAEVDGRRAGVCVATAYQQHGFIGILIVIPELRSAGLGTDLFTHAVRYLTERGMKSISLDGDSPGIPIYIKAGFHKTCRSLRFNGNIPGKLNSHVQPMSPDHLESVVNLDKELFGEDRSFFLLQKYKHSPSYCFVAWQEGKLLGYLLANSGEGVIMVGPWAVRPELAHPLTLLENLALVVPELQMRIGVLESNHSAVSKLRSMPGLVESEPSWRMILGDEPGPGSSEWLYAIGSPAKG